jgi:hypothetical protein
VNSVPGDFNFLATCRERSGKKVVAGYVSILLNSRHEAFAQAAAAGIPFKYAYEIAGYTSRRSGAAYRLADRPEVTLRIAELRAAVNPIAVAGLGQIVRELQQLTISIEQLVGRTYLSNRLPT